MLPLPTFSVLSPRGVEDAALMLADHPNARLIAGGTDLLPSMKYGLFTPPTLIRLGGIQALQEISDLEGGGLRIGAGVTLRAVGRDARVRRLYPALAAATRTIATSTIQAMGTLGGNLMLDTRCAWYNQSTFWRGALGGCLKCHSAPEGAICHVAPKGKGCYAAHSADTAPGLLLYGAEVELVSTRGARRVAVSALYGDDGRDWIRRAPDELLSAVILPPPPPGAVVHRKLRARGSIDYPLLLTAVAFDPEAGPRVVVSSVGPRPVELSGVAEAWGQGGADAVAEVAYKQVSPLSTHVWPATWRKKMVRVEVRRALEAAVAAAASA